MAEANDLWQCINQLAKALAAKGSTLDEQTARALDDFSKLPRETQEQLLRRLTEVAIATVALAAEATSRVALNKAVHL